MDLRNNRMNVKEARGACGHKWGEFSSSVAANFEIAWAG